VIWKRMQMRSGGGKKWNGLSVGDVENVRVIVGGGNGRVAGEVVRGVDPSQGRQVGEEKRGRNNIIYWNCNIDCFVFDGDDYFLEIS
jgi:hypothetical protein